MLDMPSCYQVLHGIVEYYRWRIIPVEDDRYKRECLEYMSYVRTGIDLLAQFIHDNKQLNVVDSISLFIAKCKEANEEDASGSGMFDIYADVARDVVDFLGGLNEWKWHVRY